MKLSIRKKLLISFGILLFLVIVLQIIFNIFFANDLYKQYKMNYMEETFYTIQENFTDDKDVLAEIVSDFEDRESIRIVITSDTEILYISESEFIDMDNVQFQRPSDVRESQDGQSAESETLEEPQFEDQSFSQIIPENIIPQENIAPVPVQQDEMLNLDGEFIYGDSHIYVNMTLTLASIETSANFFTTVNVIISLLVLIIGIFIALRTSRKITEPIQKIEAISSNMANLCFEEYADANTSVKELDNLAQSINQMSNELKNRIEELNSANEKLKEDVDYQKQIEQMRREFIANVSHEMKTPLAILQFYCENLKSNIDGLDRDYYCDTIIEEITRMDEMVKSLLQISSIENGLANMEMEEIDLSELARRTGEKLIPLLDSDNVRMDVVDDIKVIGDKRYLEQAMKNFLTNAVSHTKSGGKIRIFLTELENNMVRFTVYNEGNPIEPENMSRIWESFYKSDKSRVRVSGSNVGLGLYIVKSIIEQHKGNYGVQNTTHGVEFYFELERDNHD